MSIDMTGFTLFNLHVLAKFSRMGGISGCDWATQDEDYAAYNFLKLRTPKKFKQIKT